MEKRKILNENLTHNDLKDLDFEGLDILSSEIRDFLIDRVSKTGGHLASNLGVVELTVMLHRCFDFKKDDRLIFDVGHQSYVHKILTGRMSGFDSLRKTGGLSGFPNASESETDLFDTGHSGTSLSLADGIASAKLLNGEKGTCVAVVGDGAITGGLCYEALNNIGNTKKNILIILNDNGMSISKNVGAVSNLLTRVRTSRSYKKAKSEVKDALGVLKGAGRILENGIRHIKEGLKTFSPPGTLAEGLGIKYLGPVDGHDLRQLEFYIKRARNVEGPVMLHVKTVKGKGYVHAEGAPSKFHGVSHFEVDKGTTHSIKSDFSCAMGMELCLLGMKNKNLVTVCPAMTKGCGLSGFAESFPDRFFDCGIAEEHAVTFAAGLAEEGALPVVCTYSTFLQRAYDEILHDVAINNLHVVFCLDRAGLPGNDGKTHQGIYDLSYLGNIPGMAVLSPSSFAELSEMLRYAVEEHNGPIAIRYPKGGDRETGFSDFTFGKAERVKEGKDITVVAEGMMLKSVLKAAELAEAEGVFAEVIKLSTVYPADFETIEKSVSKTGRLLTVEANVKRGGMGEALFGELKVKGAVKAFPDTFIEHGSTDDLLCMYKMDVSSIKDAIIREAGAKNEA